ncbi:hypothetical protein [Actinomadura sp. 9N215]|uniref:hypothetical protein n=1 Tax=Actinomadura sp. 9N215 TaxID=3375150 RepID=UPI0037BB372D
MPNDRKVIGFTQGGLVLIESGSSGLEFWDIDLGRTIAKLDAPGASVKWLTRGHTLVGLSDGGLLSIDLDRDHWLPDLCAVNDRPYTDGERKLLPDGAETTPPCRMSD